LPALDFTTVKHDLFPVIASMFSKTSSLNIKVRGLEALGVLCGGTSEEGGPNDGLSGVLNESMTSKSTSGTSLDKFTTQEKVVPLLKAIKTKEPAVMMAALGVFQQVGKIADSDFLALDVLPTLWSFSLGPLLNLQQFQSFMKLIKALSAKIEKEQIKKLQELSSVSANDTGPLRNRTQNSQAITDVNGTGTEGDFERLVLGSRASGQNSDPFESSWGDNSNPSNAQSKSRKAPNFSWASSDSSAPGSVVGPTVLSSPQHTTSRSITPDHYTAFPTLEPANKVTSPSFAPLQPSTATRSNQSLGAGRPMTDHAMSNPSLATLASARNNTTSSAFAQPVETSSQSPFSIPPPPSTPSAFTPAPNPSSFGSFMIAPPAGRQMPPPMKPHYGAGLGQPMAIQSFGTSNASAGHPNAPQKQGLDKYESLL
jgi:SCY1-like protein 2